MKLEADHMLATMNEIDRIQSSIQEPPPASHVPDPTNVDDVVPMTSRERGGLGRRRRREEAVERRQEIAEDRQPGMYYIPQPYPYYTSQAPTRNCRGYTTGDALRSTTISIFVIMCPYLRPFSSQASSHCSSGKGSDEAAKDGNTTKEDPKDTQGEKGNIDSNGTVPT
ncbi:hypothetical protein RIF29_15494 [Crotalaria pallida]|uniref:Uncharacterized protein n=1 Tax=Crotalaria pallida TaxID=3830 RepID=A0AAN9FK84_CROPI